MAAASVSAYRCPVKKGTDVTEEFAVRRGGGPPPSGAKKGRHYEALRC
jgi:hypothetical protein